jgi:hypothetical protein
MILIAAAGVASLMSREYVAGTLRLFRRASAERLLQVVGGPMTCTAAALMVGLIAIRLRQPRPRFARLVRQPGFAASVALAGVLLVGTIEALVLIGFRDAKLMGFAGGWPFQQLWEIGAAFRGGFAVGAVWILLLLTGRWRPESSWVDRTGRACGAVWVGGLLVHYVEPWLLGVLPAV